MINLQCMELSFTKKIYKTQQKRFKYTTNDKTVSKVFKLSGIKIFLYISNLLSLLLSEIVF